MRPFVTLGGGALALVMSIGLACAGPSRMPPAGEADERGVEPDEVGSTQVGADDPCVRYCEALAACGLEAGGCVDGCTALAESAEGRDQIACVLDAEGCGARSDCAE